MTDSAGQHTSAKVVSIGVTAGATASSTTVYWESPSVTVAAGAPVTLRVCDRPNPPPCKGGGPAFQVVRFSADMDPLGAVQVPRMELRVCNPQTGEKTLVPLWEFTWVPATSRAGTSVGLRAEAVDLAGATAPIEAYMVRVGVDAPPLVTISAPGSGASFSLGRQVTVTGLVADDTMSLGVDARLLVDGQIVNRAQLLGGLNGSTAGSAPYSLSWTPGSLGPHLLEVSAVDAHQQETRRSLSITVLADAPPQLSILSPASQATPIVGSSLSLTAAVTDDSPPPVSVTWFVSGVPVGASTTSPYTTWWQVPAGSAQRPVIVTAEARDSAGNTSTQQVTITPVSDTTRPSVALVGPPSGATFTSSQNIPVSVGARDDVAVATITVTLDGQPFFEDPAPSPVPGQPGAFATHVIIPKSALVGATTVWEQPRRTARATSAALQKQRSPSLTISHRWSPSKRRPAEPK